MYREREREVNVNDSPIPVRTAFACKTSPTRPPGRTKEVPMSVETPVMKWPLLATASDPRVSVSDSKRPPCTVHSGVSNHWVTRVRIERTCLSDELNGGYPGEDEKTHPDSIGYPEFKI